MPEYRIYCDMDGVLVDFHKGYEQLTGVKIHAFTDKLDWEAIKRAGYDFWFKLEWKPDGKDLWKYIKKYKPIILSAPSREDESRVGKHDWVKRELPNTQLILRSMNNKKEFASPNSILIDDTPQNVDQWNEAGGIGILHTSTVNTIKELKKLGL
jgi:hypothetical protein